MPGAGKPITTAIVVDYLHTTFENDSTVGIAYVYCNFRRQHEQKPADILASLLKQLTRKQFPIPESVKKLHEYHKTKMSRPSFEETSAVLSSVLASFPRSFIMIDALDECQISSDSRRRLLAELFSLQASTETNLFATSPFIPEIFTEMKGSISQEIRANVEDVRAYLKGRMSRLPLCVRRSPKLQENIETEIIKAADGMYVTVTISKERKIPKICSGFSLRSSN
jgi:hypothetical protein